MFSLAFKLRSFFKPHPKHSKTRSDKVNFSFFQPQQEQFFGTCKPSIHFDNFFAVPRRFVTDHVPFETTFGTSIASRKPTIQKSGIHTRLNAVFPYGFHLKFDKCKNAHFVCYLCVNAELQFFYRLIG